QASPRITAMPSTPVHLPMNNPPTIDLGADNPTNQGQRRSGWLLADQITSGDQTSCFDKPRVGIVMDGGQRFIFFHAIADALMGFEPTRMVDGILFFLAPASQNRKSDAKLVASRFRAEATGRAPNFDMGAVLWQALRFVHRVLVAALQFNDLPEFIFRL